MKTVDFFLITYPKDYPWLPYLWATIAKRATGFRRCVLVLEPQDPTPSGLPTYVEVKRCRVYRGTDVAGYWGQSIEGLRAHEYTDADVIWFLESDCIFTRPVDVRVDKGFGQPEPCILRQKWEHVGVAAKWRPTTLGLLGEAPAETMRAHPFVYPRGHFEACWSHIGGEERLRHVVLDGGELSQFNVLGNFALIHPEGFRIIDVDRESMPDSCMKQFWSHSGVEDASVVREMEKLGLR